MTARPKEYCMPTEMLTAAIYKAQNLRRKMRETQVVLADFSSRQRTLPFKKKLSEISSFSQQSVKPNQILFKELQVRRDGEPVCLETASGKMERALPNNLKPFGGNSRHTVFIMECSICRAVG